MVPEVRYRSNARDRVRRPRLESRLAGAAPITVLVGPAGSGKSDLIRAALPDANAVYFRVGNERRRFARFVHGFAEAIAPLAPGAQASFPRAWERSLQSRSPAVVLAHWLCEHLDGFDCPIAIDDLHAAAADISVASFIATLCELRPNAPLIIAVRSVGALPIALWMATRQMQRPIDESDLQFDLEEVAQAAHQLGSELGSRTIPHLHAATRGLPVAVEYALTRIRDDAREFASTAVPASFDSIAADIFARRSEREKEFLLSAALLPSIQDDALQLLGWEQPQETRRANGQRRGVHVATG
jgi:ATP/maltotriose-dependent transcriptional regulator MalT